MTRKKASKAPQTDDDLRVEREAHRLRDRAESHLLQKVPPTPSYDPAPPAIPPTLRKSDGADIVKRNTSRKKKYLVVLPGAAALPPGARVGNLCGLDTRNPVLYVDFPPHGRAKLTGSLVFPRNSFIAIKGPSSAKKPVLVVDAFETLVVFSEWAWIGDDSSNPGQVPQPLPLALRRPGIPAPDLWRSSPLQGKTGAKASTVPTTMSKRDDEIVLDHSESPVHDAAGDSDVGDVASLEQFVGDSDDWPGRSAAINVAPRPSSSRKRKRVNYSQMLEDDALETEESKSSLDSDDHVIPHPLRPEQESSVEKLESNHKPELPVNSRPRRKRKRNPVSHLSDDEYEISDGVDGDAVHDTAYVVSDSDAL